MGEVVYYRLREDFKAQPWYNPSLVFYHVRSLTYKNRLIGIRSNSESSIWKCVQTGERVNFLDACLRPLTKEESRDFKLELLNN